MSAKRAQLVRRFEAVTGFTNASSSSGASGRGPANTGPTHPAFNRVDDSKIKQLEEVDVPLFTLASS